MTKILISHRRHMFILTQQKTGLKKKARTIERALEIISDLAEFHKVRDLKEFYQIEDMLDEEEEDSNTDQTLRLQRIG